MTDSSRDSGACSTTPHDYLATRQNSYSDERLRRSCYLTMRDGVRIAGDIFVPAEAGWRHRYLQLLYLRGITDASS